MRPYNPTTLKPIIKIESLSKQYRLGLVGTGTLRHDLNRWYHRLRGKDDPYLKIGEERQPTTDNRQPTTDYVWALKDINLEVMPGEVLGIIGKNGAGKSTLLKILSKVTGPTTGSIHYNGRIGSLLEVGTGFHPELTGRENIFLNGAILGMTKAEIRSKLDEIIDFSGCERYIETPVKRYSSGMMVRLGFAVAAHLEPEILVVDEVLAVGDAEFQKKAIGKMQDVSRNEGRTVLFVSHNMAAVKNLCKNGVLLQNGTIYKTGEIDQIIGEYLTPVNTNQLEKIEFLKERSGDQKVIFSDFHIENERGEKIDTVLTGEDLILKFIIKVTENRLKNVDLGFSFHDSYDNILCVLYSSFQSKTFDYQREGYHEIKCAIRNLNLTPGKYLIRGLLKQNTMVSDWPTKELGYLDVEMGDFYKTGNLGFPYKSNILITGEWA